MIRQIVRLVDRVVAYCCAIQLIIMLAIVFSQVVLRYVFSSPTSWSEELTLLILVWFGYLGMALGFGHDYHIGLEMLTAKCPQPVLRGLQVMSDLIVIGIAVLMIYYGNILVQKTAMQDMPALGISKAVLYFSLVASGVATVFYTAIHMVFPELFKKDSIIEPKGDRA